ncbi:MAG: hypothetical protein HOY79_17645 [Streptomyces sp.]|nr:hypothetical protein [Streptomyces sp.]
MTNVHTRTETKSWFVVVVPAPGWRADLYLGLHWAEQEYERVHGRKAESDDAFEVLASDEEIIIRFEIKTGT